MPTIRTTVCPNIKNILQRWREKQRLSWRIFLQGSAPSEAAHAFLPVPFLMNDSPGHQDIWAFHFLVSASDGYVCKGHFPLALFFQFLMTSFVSLEALAFWIDKTMSLDVTVLVAKATFHVLFLRKVCSTVTIIIVRSTSESIPITLLRWAPGHPCGRLSSCSLPLSACLDDAVLELLIGWRVLVFPSVPPDRLNYCVVTSLLQLREDDASEEDVSCYLNSLLISSFDVYRL